MRHGRLLLAFILLVGGLSPTSAVAQPPGSELIEALASDASGDEAYVVLESVDAFPAGGGEATLEPGTAYEETIAYAGADTETNRLVGLTRPAPIAHSAGVFVQAPAAEESPVPNETPSPEPSSAEQVDGAQADESTPQDGASAQPSGNAGTDQSTAGDAPDPCYLVAEQSCADLLGPVLGDPCTDAPTVCEALDDLETGDPVDDLCDPDDVGQTCGQYVQGWLVEIADILADPCGYFDAECGTTDPCDPENTGQTCVEYARGFLGENTCDPNRVICGSPPPDDVCAEVADCPSPRLPSLTDPCDDILICDIPDSPPPIPSVCEVACTDILPRIVDTFPTTEGVGGAQRTSSTDGPPPVRCTIFASDPWRTGNDINGYGWQNCSGVFTHTHMVVVIQRHRWYGWDTEADVDRPWASKSFREAEPYWDCNGTGWYTYRVVTYGYVYHPSYGTLAGSVQSGEYLRTYC